jgi:hypothetical protein
MFAVAVVVREPEAQAEFGFGAAGCIVVVVSRTTSSAARVNAFAMLTVVSLTDHLSGFDWEGNWASLCLQHH